MPAPITRRQRALTDTSLSEMPWGTMKTSDTPSTSEVHETDLAAIPSELKSPTVPPRALTLRLRGSRESAASSSTSIAAINVNHPANSSISHQHQHTHDLAVSSIIVGSDHQEMVIPTSMHLPVPPAMSSQSQVSLVSASSMESRASYRAVPSPAGTFGQPGTWWARGRRSIGDSSCAVSIISLGSAFYPGEGGNNHATINGLRKGSMDQSADSSCRVSISSVTGNISGSAGTGMATATPTATSGNRSKSGYVHSLLAVRPMVRNERPHSVELPASPTSAGGYRDPHFNDVRMEQRRAITSWHV
ncbi:hypothetical protein BDF22DRAFT_665261 [Syncephalis plumigaleata]|nr:hypothetical protein BDF22DRAFT_665261 [Syncephalis plumigaleata]